MEMKKLVVIGIILLFVGLCNIPATAQKNLSVSTNFKLESATQGLYYVFPLSIFNDQMYKFLRDWKDKPFPNTTAMFIGGGIGVLPFLNVSIVLSADSPGIPSKLDVYSDGVYYDTLYPEFWGPISARYFHLFYYEKGFHSLRFVAEDNTSLVFDVQIGIRGFLDHIFPYLIKSTSLRN